MLSRRYTIDIFLYDDNNKKYYSGTFPFSVQKELGAYLSWLIGKKPTLGEWGARRPCLPRLAVGGLRNNRYQPRCWHPPCTPCQMQP